MRKAHDDFVGRTPSYDTLDLPPIVTDENAEGVRAAEHPRRRHDLRRGAAGRAGLFSGGRPERPGLVRRRVAGRGAAGRLFDDYVWKADRRLDPAARQIQYDRIGELDDYLLRFCSAASERDRGST